MGRRRSPKSREDQREPSPFVYVDPGRQEPALTKCNGRDFGLLAHLSWTQLDGYEKVDIALPERKRLESVAVRVPPRCRRDWKFVVRTKEGAVAREAVRYLNNAREILRRVPVEGETYLDRKPVREAMGTAYLAVLEAINEALSRRGVARKDLPKSVDAYRAALQRHLVVRDGKLLREFESLYDALHIAGYYRGLIYDRKMVRDALIAAHSFIEKVA